MAGRISMRWGWRRAAGTVALAAGLFACAGDAHAQAPIEAVPDGLPGAQVKVGDVTIDTDLQTMLDLGLKTRLPEEKAYTKEVVRRVKNGSLSAELVLTSFQFARKKPKYPIRYFERALMIRADQLGIVAPTIPNSGTPTTISGTTGGINQ